MSVLTVLTKKKTFEKNQTEQWKDDLNTFNEDDQLKKLVETAIYCNDTKLITITGKGLSLVIRQRQHY